MLIWVLQSSHCFKLRLAQHCGRRGANVSENEGVRSECKKFGENSRQMAPVSTICDEYCSLMQPTLFSRRVTNPSLPISCAQLESFEEAIDDLLLPTLFAQTEPLPSDLRQLVTLTPAQEGLGVPDPRFKAPQQFAASTLIIALHVDSITTKSMSMVPGENFTEELKRQHQALKTASVRSRMESIDSTLPSDLLRSVNQSRDKGASSWLTTVPLVNQVLVLNKKE